MTQEFHIRREAFIPVDRLSDGEFDKVFVRDLVLPARIGMWREEKGVTQRVRFSVDISHRQTEPPVSATRPVISYDFIIDGIKALLAKGHILLVETLTEDIANHCLSHPGAMSVRVCVEKIDRVPDASLGCEIRRFKPTA